MATVFKRLLPAQADAQTTALPTLLRRRESVEVIDVDELDDNIYQTHRVPEPGLSRPMQPQRLSVPPEIISLVEESDDEDITVVGPFVRPPARTRLQSPPPRFPSWNHVPPVPPVPQHYAGQTSLPMRRQATSFDSPPIVRPRDQPFPFEDNMPQQQPHPRMVPLRSTGFTNRFHDPQMNSYEVLPPRPLQPAPHSHHLPSMGLGGALIAQNRFRHQHQQQIHPSANDHSLIRSSVRRIPESVPGPRNGVNFFAIGNNFEFFDDHLDADVDPDHMLALQLLAGDTGERFPDLEPTFDPARAYIRAEVHRRRNNAREASPYRKDYTHPHPPEPGFAHDFICKSPVEVIDVTSPTIPSKSVPSLGPIIIDDDDDSIADSNANKSTSKSQTPEPQLNNKPSLVCARCLEPLILGNNLTSEEQKNCRIWGLQCGHLIDGKCLRDIGQPKYTGQQSLNSPAATRVVDRKGKGKAKVVDEDENYEDIDRIQSLAHVNEPESNSIRSRLRPRHAGSSFINSPSSSSLAQIPVKRSVKSKSFTHQLLPLPRFTWKCPVIGCECVHVSIQIDGEWVPERDDHIYPNSSVSRSCGGRNGRRDWGRVANWRTLGSVRMGVENPSATPARGAIPLFL